MDERLADLVDDRLVHPRGLALQDQLDLLALLAGQVPHQPGEALEDVADGQHADVHHRLLEHRGDAAHVLYGGHQLAARRASGHRLHQVLAELEQLGAGDDQLAHQVQQVVELREVHAHGAGLRGHVMGLHRAPRLDRRHRAGSRRRGGRRGRDGGARGHGPASGGGLALTLAEEAVEDRLLRREVTGLALARAGLLHRVAQRVGPREELVEDCGGQRDPAVGDLGEDVLQPVDVLLDGREAHHPAVALQRVERAQHAGDHPGVEPLALQGEQAVVEGLEKGAGVLEIDGEELRGSLEFRHASPR